MAAPEYHYTLEFRPTALKNLGTLPAATRRQIGFSIELLQRNFSGDVKKLKGHKFEYRLRVSSFRVRFELIGRHITIYDVADRKDAYGR